MTTGTPHTKESMRVPLAVLLSLRDMHDTDMDLIRADQFRAALRNATLRSLSFLAILASFGWTLRAIAPVPLVAALIAAVTALVIVRQRYRNARLLDARRVPLSIVHSEVGFSLVGALLLSLPALYAAWYGRGDLLVEMWVTMAVGVVIYAGTTPHMPILFCATVPPMAACYAISLAFVRYYLPAAAVVALTAGATCMVLAAARFLLRLEQVRQRSEEGAETVSLLLREFEDTGADWLWQIDATRRIDGVSPRFAHAVGRDISDLEGVGFLEIVAGQNWTKGKFPVAIHELANRINRREAFSNLLVPVDLAAGRRWWELSASPRFDGEGRFIGFRGVGSDVTERRDSEEKIARLARFDPLTGLPNRTYLNETLGGALEQATAWRRRCAFMIIDLDRFKAVNDTLGHPVGDRLLAQVAARITAACGEDVVAGRLGGDEFAVIVREASSNQMVEDLGRRIIEALSLPYEVDSHKLYIGASIGYATGPNNGATVETLTRNADLALYRSKERGGGVCNGYEPALHDQARDRRDIEIELRDALKRNEFEVVYQPVVFGDGSIDGFEALLRWNNKKLGNVSPVKFIPVAEDTRLIGPIGEWVLQTACREAVNWPGKTKVAVNVSADQLADPHFVSAVVKALAHSRLPPQRLELEVTESVFLRSVSGAMATLEQIRGLGVRLSLDDFGTGYSSLGYLRMGQFSTIKVDRSFVQSAIGGARESIAIIRAVVALAESLDMNTTAEGIESADEAAAILALGCTKLQGYHFGRPMTAADARSLFPAGVENRRAG